MFLSEKIFSTVIEHSPLVSIDLVVKNTNGQAILGKRINKPAQGYWFVPGGRVLKGERLAAAFKRLTKIELGQEFSLEQADLLGPYDHFYTDNVFGANFTTHYVAIAYILTIDISLDNLPLNEQHTTYQWFDISEITSNHYVHKNTAVYFE